MIAGLVACPSIASSVPVVVQLGLISMERNK